MSERDREPAPHRADGRPDEVGPTIPAEVAAGRDLLAPLRTGRLEVHGRLLGSTNHALLVTVEPADDGSAQTAPAASLPRGPARDSGGAGHGPAREAAVLVAVYKPIRGERPLDDFPDGTLAYRETAAYVASEAIGWGIVPPTVLRDGPYGPGMVQLWIDADDRVDRVALVAECDERLRRIAVFDALVNNADRKIGHLLPVPSGHIYGVDHGICFAVEPKLRTVLWGWRGQRLRDEELAAVERFRRALEGEAGEALRALLSEAEVRATVRRAERLLETGRFPSPDPFRPAIPWPPY